MESSFEQFSKIPTGMLKDVTALPPESQQTQSGAGSDPNLISEGEALGAANHTKITPLDSATGQNGSNGPNPTSGPGTTKVNVGDMFEGKFAVDLLDALLPALLVVALKAMKVTVRKTEVQLTESEKKTLAPIVQNCLNTLHLDFNNPWTALSVTAGIIYGSKLVEKGAVAWLDKKATEPIKEKVKDVTKETTYTNAGSGASTLSKTSDKQTTNQKTTEQFTPPTWTDAQIIAEGKRLRRGREGAIDSLNKLWRKRQKI